MRATFKKLKGGGWGILIDADFDESLIGTTIDVHKRNGDIAPRKAGRIIWRDPENPGKAIVTIEDEEDAPQAEAQLEPPSVAFPEDTPF